VQPSASPTTSNRHGVASSRTGTSYPPNISPRETSSSRLTTDELLNPSNDSTDAPPGYTPSLNNPDPAVRILSQQAIGTKLKEFETTLKRKNRGSISIKPFTGEGGIDAVQLVYIGLTQLELTSRELGTPVYLHSSFGKLCRPVYVLSLPIN
jgi:hypothetical protein